MASLIRRGDLYYLEFCDRRRTPRKVRFSLKTRTRREAEKLRRTLEDRYASGSFDPWQDTDYLERPPAAPITKLGDAYDLFSEEKSSLRKPTRDHYRWIVGGLVGYLGRDFPLEGLTHRHLMRWLAGLENPVSRQTYFTRLRVFVRFLVEQGLLETDITRAIRLEKPPEKLAGKLITPEHLSKIVEVAAASSTPYIADLAVVTFDLALRLGEVCAMRCYWVDLDRQRLTIHQETDFTTKTGLETSKPVSRRAAEVLRRLLDQRQKPASHVFLNTEGRPLEPKQTSKTFKRIIRRAGLPETLTFHGLRHGGLSHLIAEGASIEAVRRFAGHTRIDMTMRYVHLQDRQFDDQIRKAMSRLG